MRKKICVIGAGDWGKNHIKTLYHLNSLRGIVEVNNEVLESNLNIYPKVKGYPCVHDALKDNYDGFVIATPAKTHCKIAKTIVSSKKPLLIEKPMVLSIKEAKELIGLVEKYRVNVLVGHVLLFHPAIIKIKDMIDRGEIGDLQYIYSNRLNLGKVRTEENVFWSFHR